MNFQGYISASESQSCVDVLCTSGLKMLAFHSISPENIIYRKNNIGIKFVRLSWAKAPVAHGATTKATGHGIGRCALGISHLVLLKLPQEKPIQNCFLELC